MGSPGTCGARGRPARPQELGPRGSRRRQVRAPLGRGRVPLRGGRCRPRQGGAGLAAAQAARPGDGGRAALFGRRAGLLYPRGARGQDRSRRHPCPSLRKLRRPGAGRVEWGGQGEWEGAGVQGGFEGGHPEVPAKAQRSPGCTADLLGPRMRWSRRPRVRLRRGSSAGTSPMSREEIARKWPAHRNFAIIST